MAANNIYIQIDVNSQSAQANVNALNQSLANTGPTTEKSAKQATTGLQSIGISVKQVNNEFAQLTSALAGLGLARMLAGVVQMSADLSRAKLAMQSFTGSAEEANKVFEEVRAIAATSPFRFKDLEQTARQLLGFGMAAKNVPDTLRVITDQVARMGGSIENVNNVVRLFGRIMEKDFVGAMDLMRSLPQQGVQVMNALRDAMSKQLGRAIDVEDVKTAIKEGILDPLQTIRVVLDSMRQSGGFGKTIADAAIAFKNMADAVENAASQLFGPQGFGPALSKLAGEIGDLLAPLGGVVDYLMKLPGPTKELVVNVAAGAAAFAAFGTALSVVVGLASPLMGLVSSVLKFAGALAVMNPELTLAIVLLSGLAFAAYKFIPQFKQNIDNLVGNILDKIKTSLAGLAEEGKKFFAGIFGGGQKIDVGDILDTSKVFEKLKLEEQKHANEAQRTLLEALASPVEAVRMKYATLFAELEEKIKLLPVAQQQALRGILSGAELSEATAAQFKENRKQLDEYTRYQVERAKGAADAQIAYIEAQDAQDLRSKVRAYDQITQIRIESAQQVADIEKGNLEKEFNAFVDLATRYKAEFAKAGIDVNEMIDAHRKELGRKEAMADQKAFDDIQKYRLEGWKRANDAIIEDQKRVYDAFKDQFSQLFDVFTDKTKSLGQALGDFFKKLVLGEAKEMFANAMAGVATEAAGYGRPEESLRRGGQGILGTLLRRGMPPRPPLMPPEVQEIPAAVSGFSFPPADALNHTANRFEISTDAYADATVRFADAVATFAGATVSSQGYAARAADSFSDAFQAASQATGVPQPLLRAVAQAESSLNPLAVSPKGAMGLMQLMPRTAAGLGVTDPFDVSQSLMGGAQELQRLYSRYGGWPQALAAYNYGQGNYDRAVAAGRALPRETQAYVSRIMKVMATTGAADLVPDEEARWARATGGGTGPAVSFEQLANLPMRTPALSAGFMLPDYGSAAGGHPSIWRPGDSAAVPSVAELASLPQQASALQRLAPLLGPFLGGGGTGGGGGGGVSLAGLVKLASGGGGGLRDLAAMFGIGTAAATAVRGQTPGMESLGRVATAGFGGTSLRSVLTSRAVGALATLGGMALATKGLQQHYAPATVAGGGLAGAGYVLSNPSLLASTGPVGIGAGAAAGAGLGLFASGFQRGGGAGVAMDIGGGALAGAGIGFLAGGPLGAAIGAAIGAGVGAITGVVRLFVHTEQERIRTTIKQVYGIDISNRSILTQIQQIVDQKYGGSVSIGVRSQDVQDIIRLYALSTGQAAMLPRPMYAATIAQSTQGLQTQAVYQGGIQVQNPYSGPTTYQYATAVASGVGLKGGTSLGVPGAGGLLNQQWQQLTLDTIRSNPSAIAQASAAAASAGDSRLTTTQAMQEPLTALG